MLLWGSIRGGGEVRPAYHEGNPLCRCFINQTRPIPRRAQQGREKLDNMYSEPLSHLSPFPWVAGLGRRNCLPGGVILSLDAELCLGETWRRCSRSPWLSQQQVQPCQTGALSGRQPLSLARGIQNLDLEREKGRLLWSSFLSSKWCYRNRIEPGMSLEKNKRCGSLEK